VSNNKDKSLVILNLRQKTILCFVIYSLYSLAFLLFLPHLKISVNYFIIPPIIASAFCFGFPGGIISGSTGLPFNLLLLYFARSLNCAPESLLIAQISGMIVGTGLGLTGSYINRSTKELARRKKREEELKIALEEKDTLYKELNHRVKNNLNIVKSLIQMQVYRSDNEDFIGEGNKLISRILSISLIHEQLYTGQISDTLNLKDYLVRLIKEILSSHSEKQIVLNHSTSSSYPSLIVPTKQAISVGLIINEVITNCIKYAFNPADEISPEITLTLESKEEALRIKIWDNGSSFKNQETHEGLGMILIKTLTNQLNGKCSYIPLTRGTDFSLVFPLEKSPSPSLSNDAP
jgi:two-component sensor histidine kinase